MRVREEKIKELQGDKVKLKQLLKKAKDAIDSLNTKYKQTQEALRGQQGKNREIARTLEVMQHMSNGVTLKEVARVVCRLKVEGIGYTLVEKIDGQGCTWY
jgi:predicted RNase H-like nuclease (RuvC/YqgF family)